MKKIEIKDAKPTVDQVIFKLNIAIVGSLLLIFIFLFVREGIGSWFTLSYLGLDILYLAKKYELILKPISGNFTTQLTPVLLTPTQANQICTYLTVKTSLVVVLP